MTSNPVFRLNAGLLVVYQKDFSVLVTSHCLSGSGTP